MTKTKSNNSAISPTKACAVSSNERGRHSELLAQTALLANGWSVLEPISPQPYDLAIRNPVTSETLYVQVKTAYERDERRYGGTYVIIKGARNNGLVYGKDEVDAFIAVHDNAVYMLPNREKSEYWVRKEQVGELWTRLELDL